VNLRSPSHAAGGSARWGSGLGLLLAPGAGAGRDQPGLVAFEEALEGTGVSVERMDFPYRRAGRRVPDRAPVLLAALVEAAVSLGGRCERIVVGGRSMGGRIASLAVATGLLTGSGLDVAGLVCISYPLHPPGRPDRLRVEHFGSLRVPTLFVSGTRDAFGTPEELAREVAAIGACVELAWLEGRDHSLKGAEPQVASVVVDWLQRLAADAQ